MKSCLAVVAASLMASAWLALGRLELLLAYLVPMTLSGAIVAIILTSTLTKTSSVTDAGSVLGLDMGVGTAARVLAPTIGGWLLAVSYETVGTVAACIALAAWGVSQSNGGDMFASKNPSQAAVAGAGEEQQKQQRQSKPQTLKKEL